MAKKITEFLPRMLDHSRNELYRMQIGDIINIVEGYEKLWQTEILTSDDFNKVHKHCEGYLANFLEKTKRTVSGKQYADLLKLIGQAKFHGVHEYEEQVRNSLEKDFTSFHAENSHFAVTDLLNLLVAFDRLC